MCRSVFFPSSKAAAFSELGDPDDEEEEEDLLGPGIALSERPTTEPSQDLIRICNRCLRTLNLSVLSSRIARQMAYRLDDHYGRQNQSPEWIVALSLYITTHIMRENRSLEEISTVSGLSTENIRGAYSVIYPHRDSIFTRRMLDTLSGNVVRDIMDLLPLPELEDDLTYSREYGRDRERHLLPTRAEGQDILDSLPLPETETDSTDPGEHRSDLEPQFPSARALERGELFEHCNHQLAFPEDALMIARSIGSNIECKLHPTDGSPLPVVAVSFYMASYLVGSSRPAREIAEVVGISEGTVRFAYRIMYCLKGKIVDEILLDDVRILQLLRTLAWPDI